MPGLASQVYPLKHASFSPGGFVRFMEDGAKGHGALGPMVFILGHYFCQTLSNSTLILSFGIFSLTCPYYDNKFFFIFFCKTFYHFFSLLPKCKFTDHF